MKFKHIYAMTIILSVIFFLQAQEWPHSVDLLFPTSPTMDCLINPTFEWHPNSDGVPPSFYELTIYEGAPFISYAISIIEKEIPFPATQYTLEDTLKLSQTYFWTIRSDGFRPPSNTSYNENNGTWMFATTSGLWRTNLLSPVNNEEEVELLPSLIWEVDAYGPPYKTHYQVLVSKQENLTEPIIDEIVPYPTSQFDIESALEYNTTYYWSVIAVNEIGKSTNNYKYSFTTIENTSNKDNPPNLMTDLNFYVYPNPFNPSTTIKCEMRSAESGVIEVFNIKGQKVKTLFNGYLEVGEHSFIWNGDDNNGNAVSSGIYFCRMKTDDYSEIKKMILMK